VDGNTPLTSHTRGTGKAEFEIDVPGGIDQLLLYSEENDSDFGVEYVEGKNPAGCGSSSPAGGTPGSRSNASGGTGPRSNAEPPTSPSGSMPSKRASKASNGNLVPNADMAALWDHAAFGGLAVDVSLDATTTYNGKTSLKFTGDGAFWGGATSPSFTVDDRLDYTLSSFIKTDNITDYAEMNIFWYDADGNSLNQWNDEGAALHKWGQAIGGQLDGTHDWTEVSGIVTPPEGAVMARVEFRVRSHDGTAWVSDVRMQAIAP